MSLRAAAFLFAWAVLPACGRLGEGEPALPAHVCVAYRTTPGGHEVCDDPKDSVAAGWVTEAEIDQAVDATFLGFLAEFPGASLPAGLRVMIHDGWIYRLPDNALIYHEPAIHLVSGDTDMATYVRAALWTVEKERPLVPYLRHELGHVAFGVSFEHFSHAAPFRTMGTRTGPRGPEGRGMMAAAQRLAGKRHFYHATP